jgi:hypothetical protein
MKNFYHYILGHAAGTGLGTPDGAPNLDEAEYHSRHIINDARWASLLWPLIAILNNRNTSSSLAEAIEVCRILALHEDPHKVISLTHGVNACRYLLQQHKINGFEHPTYPTSEALKWKKRELEWLLREKVTPQSDAINELQHIINGINQAVAGGYSTVTIT